MVDDELHFTDRGEFQAHFVLLVAHFADFLHDAHQCFDVVVPAVNAHAHSLDPLGKRLEVALGLLVQVLAENFLDRIDRVFDAFHDVFVVEQDGADREVQRFFLDVFFETVERFQLRTLHVERGAAVLELVDEVGNLVHRLLFVVLLLLGERPFADVEFLLSALDRAG